jgi:hypothetical protein
MIFIHWMMECMFGEWHDHGHDRMRRFKRGRWLTRSKTHREVLDDMWL